MIEIKNKVDCCGCNACGDVCPKGAIGFARDGEGFLYPQVDQLKCVNCGLCEKVCPQMHAAELKQNEFETPKAIAAIHKNYAIRFDSTSGGLFSALAKYAYSGGGFVGGAVWSEDWEIRQIVTDRRTDLPRLRSSKYAQSDARGFYRAVKEAVQTGKPVVVCGTPCQMAALKAYISRPCDNLYILDFICRGNNSPLIIKKYVEHFEKKVGSKLVAIKFKNKELGWRNLVKKLTFKNGDVVWDDKNGLYSKTYHKCHVFCRPSCYACKFKGLPDVSDITLGDAWLKDGILDKDMDHDLGTSLVLINNSKGERLFNSIAKSLKTQPLTWQNVIDGNPMFDKSLAMPNLDRDFFFRMLKNDGLEKVVECAEEKERERHAQTRAKLHKIKSAVRHLLRIVRWSVKSPICFLRAIRANGFKKVLIGRPLILPVNPVTLEIDGELVLKGDLQLASGFFKKPTMRTALAVRNGGRLECQGRVHFCYGADIEVFEGGHLTLGDDCGFNLGATIVCGERITLGKGVKGGRHVTIRDNNGGHWMNFPGYKNSRPVEIGDHVWLCEGCTIMPGVKIGAGAVVGAKAVVFEDVPANALVVGNPAHIVNENVEWKY